MTTPALTSLATRAIEIADACSTCGCVYGHVIGFTCWYDAQPVPPVRWDYDTGLASIGCGGGQ